MPAQACLIGCLLVNHSPWASATRCRIKPYLIKGAPAAPLARRQRRALPWKPARRTPGRIPVGRPDQNGSATASSVRECGSALGVQHRISSRPVAIRGAIKVSAGPGPRRLRRSPQRRDEGGLLPLAGSPTSEPVRRGAPYMPHNSAKTRRRHHAQLQAALAQCIGACEE
jgi:hypothetical protein